MDASSPESRRNARILVICQVLCGNGDGDMVVLTRRMCDLCKTLSNEHVYLLGRCCTHPVFCKGVSNVSTFIPKFADLVYDPYLCMRVGEDLPLLLDVRDTIMDVISEALAANKLCGQPVATLYHTDPCAHECARHSLWLWTWWELHGAATYVPASVLYRNLSHRVATRKGGRPLEWARAVEHLVYAPPSHKESVSARTDCVEALSRLVTHRRIRDCEAAIDELFTDAKVVVPSLALSTRTVDIQDMYQLDPAQAHVITQAMASPVFMLQGGAGVGKTTTMSALVEVVQAEATVQVVCLAFTHKAKRCLAERMAAQTTGPGKNGAPSDRVANANVRISTIHSFIQMLRSQSPRTIQDWFIVLDESSMVDLELLAELARTLKQSASMYQLCLVGDYDQLAPVGRGEVFRSIVAATRDSTTMATLETCYRTNRPDLFEACVRIRQGHLPASTKHFAVQLTPNDSQTTASIKRLIHSTPVAEMPVFITWQNKDVCRINGWVQAWLLANGLVGPQRFAEFYVGDKVMYVGENETLPEKANPRTARAPALTAVLATLTNATMGRVLAVQAPPGGLTIEWNTEAGPVQRVHKAGSKTAGMSTRDIRLAYCLTVHKSQGSEYDHVVVVCYEVAKMMQCLDRRWLYTAVSRGKQSVQLVGTQDLDDFVRQSPKAPEPLYLQVLADGQSGTI